jgi:plastocyanin
MDMRRSTVLIGMLAGGLLLAACGGSSDDSGSNGGRPSVTATVASPEPSATQPSPTESATSGETKIAMEDNMFVPATLSVSSGTTLELDNEGQSPHTFTIDGQNVDVQVNAGENGTATINLPAGSYDFYCKFHKSLGMTGTLTVS